MLERQINPKTRVVIQPTQQFSTIRIECNFSCEMAQAEVAERALMAKMLEEASEKYASQTALARKLSQMYGADYGVEVFKLGARHVVKIHLLIIDARFAEDGQDLFAEALSFLKEMITAPLGDAKRGFDLTIFERQKDFLLDEMAALEDDRPYLANRQALKAYFSETKQALPAYGTTTAIGKVTPLQAFKAFEKMMTTDQLDILVSGDVEENASFELVENDLLHDLKVVQSTEHHSASLYYHQALKPAVKSIQAQQPVNQSQLVMIYQLDIPTDQRFAAYVFEAIFGGTPVSRLFMDVRETKGLAYTISTDYNRFTDVLMVSAGVASNQIEATKQAIQTNLKTLQTQLVDEAELGTTKQLMQNDFVASLDNQSQIQERAFVATLTGQPNQDWLQQLEQVTAQAVLEVAKKASLQLVYVLKGEAQDARNE